MKNSKKIRLLIVLGITLVVIASRSLKNETDLSQHRALEVRAKELLSKPITRNERAQVLARLPKPVQDLDQRLDQAQLRHQHAYNEYADLSQSLISLSALSPGQNTPEMQEIGLKIDDILLSLKKSSQEVADLTAKINQEILRNALTSL